ncbi:MAG: SDR family oxidoreductase [Gammaproteobacteria bacterium]
MNSAKILVAGATGTNGRELLRQLSLRRIPVRALARDVNKAAYLASNSVELVEGDLADAESLTTALGGIEKAFIVTAVHPDTTKRFENFFNSAIKAGVQHVVKFSGLSASKESPSIILRQHGESDELLVQSGLAYTLLRPNSFFQNMLWQTKSIADTGEFSLPFGDAKQSMVDVRDLAAAAVRVLTESGHEDKTYNLTGPDSLSYFDVAGILSRVAGKEIVYAPVSTDQALKTMLESGLPQWDAQALCEIQAYFAMGHHSMVTDDLTNLLGRPATRFEQFAQDFGRSFSR